MRKNRTTMPRTVHPELFKNLALMKTETKTQLPLTLILLAIYMYSDREGRFVWDPEAILYEVLPTKVGVNIDAAFYELLNLKLIQQYTHTDTDGSEMILGYVVDWHEHQNINGREKPSMLPPPNNPNLAKIGDSAFNGDSITSEQESGLFSEISKPSSLINKPKRNPNVTSYRGTFFRINSAGEFVLLAGEFDESPMVNDLVFYLNTGEISYISSEKYNQYENAYPGIDIMLRMKNCAQWTVDNARKRKTHAGLTAFINQWLANAQNRNQGLTHTPAIKPGSIDRVGAAVELVRRRMEARV